MEGRTGGNMRHSAMLTNNVRTLASHDAAWRIVRGRRRQLPSKYRRSRQDIAVAQASGRLLGFDGSVAQVDQAHVSLGFHGHSPNGLNVRTTGGESTMRREAMNVNVGKQAHLSELCGC